MENMKSTVYVILKVQMDQCFQIKGKELQTRLRKKNQWLGI